MEQIYTDALATAFMCAMAVSSHARPDFYLVRSDVYGTPMK